MCYAHVSAMCQDIHADPKSGLCISSCRLILPLDFAIPCRCIPLRIGEFYIDTYTKSKQGMLGVRFFSLADVSRLFASCFDREGPLQVALQI